MRILFIHQNFPGQYRGLAPAMMVAGHEVLALSTRKEPNINGIRNITYDVKRANGKNVHPWLISTETAMIRGEAVAKVVQNLSKQGWTPDVVVGHTGWGEMMFLRQVLPKARIVGFCEYWYLGEGSDVNFDKEFPSSEDTAFRCHTRNMHLAMSLLNCDYGVSPTEWQASLFPDQFRSNLKIVHDGIETDKLIPKDDDSINLMRDGFVGKKGDEIVTFINRNLEPMRGYHQFMRALPEIMARRPNAHVVIVGGDRVSYGAPAPGGGGYKNIFLNEVADKLDVSRLHFVRQVPYSVLISLLRVSAAHVYFTYPFVLSWSMLEAMSVEALVIGSDTPPVRDAIEHGKNGLLVDFFSPKQLADSVCDVLAHPDDYRDMRRAARQTIQERFDFKTVCLPQHEKLMQGTF